MTHAGGRTNLSIKEAARTGMLWAVHARETPNRPAILTPQGDHTWDELNARCNQLLRALKSEGLKPGDPVALLCSNRPEFVEVLGAVSRGGFRLTPINFHLTGDEVGYILDDCEARAFIADARFAAAARRAAEIATPMPLCIAVGDTIEGFQDYDELLEDQDASDPEQPVLGSHMLYTSGTTGRPKGVYRKRASTSSLIAPLTRTASFRPGEDLALNTGPLYHAAPLALNLMFPLSFGVGVVVMDRWDPEEALRLVEKHRITHTHMVPTMFHHLLQLPAETRERYDTSSLRWIVHGAAPCPVHVKQALIDWLGPVVHEYYAATEGGGTFIEASEWLQKPGSVGRRIEGQVVEVRDDKGKECRAGEIGTVFFKAPNDESRRFEYFKAPEKTTSAYRGDHFTLGDLGYFDADGYLFLTGRSAELIISGGINIYPAEVDEALLRHPAVSDVATIGVPNPEWGEEVKAVILPADGFEPGDALVGELLEHCRQHLAGFKCPRSIDFTDALPRLPTGKIVRRQVRDRYTNDAPTE